MDAGEMAGLAGAAGAVGQGVGTLAQDQFSEQTAAANQAQREALALQAQKAESDRQDKALANTNTNESANRAQRDTFHSQDFTLKQSVDQHTADNQDANTRLRGAEVGASVADKAQSIAASKAKTPAEVAHLQAMAAGADKLPAGVNAPMLTTATKEWEQTGKAVDEANKALAEASKHTIGDKAQAASAAAQTALQQAQQRQSEARARLDSLSGLDKGTASGGIAPTTKPATAAGPLGAPPPTKDGQFLSGSNGQKFVSKNGQWTPYGG